MIAGHVGVEAWWSASTFAGNYRNGEKWESAYAIALDLDYHGEDGKHATIPPDLLGRAVEALGDLPNLIHPTPRGLRAVFVLSEPIRDHETFARAARGAETQVAAVLGELIREREGLTIDPTVTKDRARFLWTPGATVDGVKRVADVRIARTEPRRVEDLAARDPKSLESAATAAPANTNARPSNGLPGLSDRIKRASAYLSRIPGATSGAGGHATTWSAALSIIRGFALPTDVGFDLLDREYNPRCVPPWTEKELRHKVEDAAKANAAEGYLLAGSNSSPAEPAPEAERFTDTGNAARFVAQHGEDLRYVYPWDRWIAWDGKRWTTDALAQVERRAKRTARTIFDEAKAAKDPAEANRLAIHAAKSLSAARLDSMIALARCELAITPDDLDRGPWLLNVANGTIDLRTGELRPYRREDFLTKLCPVEFHPDATAPAWDRFLLEIMEGKDHLVRYLARMLGYCATGDVREDALWFFHGSGANGKTTVTGAISFVLGTDYSAIIAPELLLERRGEAHPTGLADLFGIRLAYTHEIDEGRKLAEGLTKQLTGRDCVKARRMREDFWSFVPTHKIILATNHKPEIHGGDYAIWRRIRLVPFNVTVPPEKQDKELPAKLRAEAEGILAWLVRGAVAWYAEGLRDPAEVLAATAEYREEQDALAGFIEDCCIVLPPARASARDLYTAYTRWVEEKGTGDPVKQNAFGRRLADRGFRREKNRGDDNRIWWSGIGLRGREPGED
ncbi:MAG: hypothetical protein HY716_04020 [Planctomycetes bacterium]|nr:hypothetical protein [Planctomycetota bacterium]